MISKEINVPPCRGAATYNIFCLPDQGNPAGYLLAKLRADAAYIHR